MLNHLFIERNTSDLIAMRRILLLLLLLIPTAACQSLAEPTATPTTTSTTTPSSTPTLTNTPSQTTTPTSSPTVTSTPTPTNQPTATASPTVSPTASVTPAAAAQFVYDNWTLVELPASFQDGIDNPLVAFINQNDRDGVGDVRTPQPATNAETLYFASATNPGGRTPILQLPASTNDQVYIAQPGNAVAYFQQGTTSATTGLYILDVSVGISGRVITMDSLIQGGFISEPTWSPDGSQLAISLETGYATDVFTVSRDGSNITNMTNSGAYEVWPSWSPDGRYLLFVSDRAHCPSWRPGDENACDAITEPPPNGGNLYVYDFVDEEIRQISDQWLTEAPRWVNERQIAFASGEPVLGDPERLLYITDVVTGQERTVRMQDGPANQINLAEAWSPNGGLVVFQDASGTSNPVVMMNASGNVIGRNDELNFPRFGISAAWSPDSTRVAIGGVGGNCPYGARVLDSGFNVVASGNPPPSMCDPVFSPDGQLLAFTGVNPRIDGRVDVYIANNNGFGAVNLTGDLRGQIKLIGWVG